MRLNAFLPLTIAIMTVAMLASCRSSKTATQPVTPEQLATFSIDQRYNAMVDNFNDWKTLSVPVKVELTQPKKFSISGRAYMVKDKSVFVSLKFLGMEVGTLYLTSDSIFVTEKVNKYYVAEGLKSLLGSYPLTVSDIQSLLLGQPFIVGDGTLNRRDKKKLDLKEISGQNDWSITPRKPQAGINYWFNVNNFNQLKNLTVTTQRYAPAHVVYADPINLANGAGAINDRLTIQASAGKTNVSATLKWNFQKARWNEKEMRQWKRPKNDYKRLRQSQLIQILSSF